MILKNNTLVRDFSFKNNKLDYFLFYLLWFFSVLNFTGTRREFYYVLFVLAAVIFFRKRNRFSLVYIIMITMYVVLILLQIRFYEKGTLYSVIGQFMFITYPFFLVNIFKKKYHIIL